MKYPFRVYQMQVEEHLFWVAESPALKGCVGQGETPEEALKELETNEQSWLQLAEEYGIKIPEISLEVLSTYSGKGHIVPEVRQAIRLVRERGLE